MATAQFAQRGATPRLFKSDVSMDSFFDVNTTAFSPQLPSHPLAATASSSSAVPLAYHGEEEIFSGPSHEYDRFPQQTGVGIGNVRNLGHLSQPMPESFNTFGGFNSGIDDSSFGMGWDMDSDMNMDMTMLGPNKFVDPSYIEHEEPQSSVGRLWPGMHQQAAIVKAQQQQPQQQAKGKGRANPSNDSHTEESISRLLNQMRHNGSNLSTIGEDDGSVQDGFSNSSFARNRKDEDDMDEDERLLASDEGKKLSSKERRQLRNKVSARAFRSRRKEYIGQLEGEVAVKVQEASTLKDENTALSEENARYRALIQTLLRHPSFTPFIEDISKDPAWIATQQGIQQSKQPQPRRSAAPSSQQIAEAPKPVVMDASTDLSMLNLSNGYNNQQNMAFDFSQPQTFVPQSFPQVPSQLDMTLDASRSRNGSYL